MGTPLSMTSLPKTKPSWPPVRKHCHEHPTDPTREDDAPATAVPGAGSEPLPAGTYNEDRSHRHDTVEGLAYALFSNGQSQVVFMFAKSANGTAATGKIMSGLQQNISIGPGDLTYSGGTLHTVDGFVAYRNFPQHLIQLLTKRNA